MKGPKTARSTSDRGSGRQEGEREAGSCEPQITAAAADNGASDDSADAALERLRAAAIEHEQSDCGTEQCSD